MTQQRLLNGPSCVVDEMLRGLIMAHAPSIGAGSAPRPIVWSGALAPAESSRVEMVTGAGATRALTPRHARAKWMQDRASGHPYGGCWMVSRALSTAGGWYPTTQPVRKENETSTLGRRGLSRLEG